MQYASMRGTFTAKHSADTQHTPAAFITPDRGLYRCDKRATSDPILHGSDFATVSV